MNRNEPNAALRKLPPCPVWDLDGALLAGQTFTTAAGEMLVSLDGATPTAAALDGVPVGRGLYHYVASLGETDRNVDIVAFFVKKARLDLATKTTNSTSKIRWKRAGIEGNLGTLAWVQSGAVSPTTGTLTHSTSVDPVSGATLTNYVFTFKDAITTNANWEALATASADLEIDVAGASATLHTVDAFAATALTGGLRDASVRQEITQPSSAPSAATIASAVWGALSEGSTTYGDQMRGIMSGVAGLASGFLTGVLRFMSMNGAKERFKSTLVPDGRSTVDYTDLTP